LEDRFRYQVVWFDYSSRTKGLELIGGIEAVIGSFGPALT